MCPRQQDVIAVEVTMQHILGVQVLQRPRYLTCCGQGLELVDMTDLEHAVLNYYAQEATHQQQQRHTKTAVQGHQGRKQEASDIINAGTMMGQSYLA